MSDEALALVEFNSVAGGLFALDALVKRAPIEVLEANLVEPGKYLVLIAGGVAEVSEALTAATGDTNRVTDKMMLARAHPGLIEGLRGALDLRDAESLDTVGVIEATSIAATLRACDRSLKDAAVSLSGIRVTGGLGGRAYFVVYGRHEDVLSAIDVARDQLADRVHATECIARPHPEMVRWILTTPTFSINADERG